MEHTKFKRELDVFIHNVAWLRKHHGLSKKEMARRLEIGLGTLNKIEKGEIPPKLSCEIVFAVYKQFGIDPSEQFSKWLEDE